MTTKLVAAEPSSVCKVLLRKPAAEWPWPIPVGWRWERIGDVTQIVGGGTPRTGQPENFGDDIPWITPADLSGYTNKYISRGARSISQTGLATSGARVLPAGTVLFSSRAPIGYVAIAKNPVATNQGFKSFVLNPNLIPDFVYYWLQVAKPMAVKLASGTTFLEISGKKIAELPIPVAPLASQWLVAAYLDEQLSRLDASVAALLRAQANFKRYRASVLKAACEGRLVPTEADLARVEGQTFETGARLLERVIAERREGLAALRKHDKAVSPSVTGLPRLPAAWAWASIEQINLASRPCAYGVLQPGSDQPDGVRFVRVGDIVDGHIQLDGLKQIDPTVAAAYPRTKLLGGEVLITLVGAIGRTAVVPPMLAGANTARAVGVIPLSRSVCAEWVELWFRNPSTIDRMTAASHEVARKTLNLEDVRLAAVPLPPLAEQHRIVAEADRRLSLIRAAEAQVTANLARAKRLRQSILQAAFAAPGSAGQ